MQNRPALNALAVLIIAGSTGAIGWATLPRVADADSRLQEEIGRALAQEAVKLATAHGKLTVILRDTEAFPQPATDHVKAGFEKEARRAGHSEITYQGLQTDPLRPVQVPGGDFLETMRRGATGDVIVSLLGPPVIAEEKRPQAGAVKAKIVAFCPGPLAEQIDLRALAEQGLLHGAVITRPAGKRSGASGSNRPATFDDLYERVGAAELANRTAASLQP